MTATKLRLFFALWPTRAAAQALHAWASAAQRACGGRVTHADKIHLTLAFLGEIASARMPDAIHAAHAVRGDRHTLHLEVVRHWPRNQIVFAAPLETPGSLAVLAAQLAGKLKDAGFTLETRPFAVHITLIRKARAAEALPVFRPVAWPVEELVLVRSELSARGSRYETLERFALT